jgi:putative endonuclease
VDRKQTGLQGEIIARDFLKKKGYRVLETNYRCREGEIDIIARQRDSLVFLEVRTKTSVDFGSAQESITATKRRHLKRSAYHYLSSHPDSPALWRIDFIAVELDGDCQLKKIEHLENAIEEY